MQGPKAEEVITVIFSLVCFFGLGIIAIWGLDFKFTHGLSVMVLWFLGLCLLFIVGFLLVMSSGADAQASNIKKIVEDSSLLIDAHIETLARQRIQLIRKDHYGIVDTSKWKLEVQRFIDSVLFRDFIAKDKKFSSVKNNFNEMFHQMVEAKSEPRAAAIESELSFSNKMSPHEFERWCTKIISSNGWVANTTKSTGDQGADVVAEKGGSRIVLQCKLYSSPVGNKAVQEAYSAQRHYMANASAVVTNASFTPSAIALAATTGVQLLHYTDLNLLKST